MLIDCSLGVYYIPGTRRGTRIASHFILSHLENNRLSFNKCKITDDVKNPADLLSMKMKTKHIKAILTSISEESLIIKPVEKYLSKFRLERYY